MSNFLTVTCRKDGDTEHYHRRCGCSSPATHQLTVEKTHFRANSGIHAFFKIFSARTKITLQIG